MEAWAELRLNAQRRENEGGMEGSGLCPFAKSERGALRARMGLSVGGSTGARRFDGMINLSFRQRRFELTLKL